ncbi:MAG: hypothetical protein DRI23_13375, partial [Candidatus Cloacimonadota bacterium]
HPGQHHLRARRGGPGEGRLAPPAEGRLQGRRPGPADGPLADAGQRGRVLLGRGRPPQGRQARGLPARGAGGGPGHHRRGGAQGPRSEETAVQAAGRRLRPHHSGPAVAAGAQTMIHTGR